MTISRLLKQRSVSILITLLTLQMTANATAANINAGKKGSTNNATVTTIISGTDSARIKEDYDPDGDNLLEASGKLDITAANSSEAAFIATTIYGDYGNLIIAATGNWFYAAENDQAIIQNLTSSDTAKDTLTVSSVDGTTHQIVIMIKGVNETSTTDTTIINSPAIISGVDTGSVTEDVDPDGDNLLETAGKLDIIDNDAGEAAFIATTVLSSYGSLTINGSGDWSYAADNSQLAIQNLASGATLKDSLTVSSIDGTMHTVMITVFGADEAVLINHPAAISGVDNGTVTEDVDPDGDNLLEVAGKLDITDNDAGEAAFIATTVYGSYGSLTIRSIGDWSYAADNSQLVIQNLVSGATLKDSLTVSSLDGTTHTVVITIQGADEANSPAVISGVDTGSVTEDVDPDGDNLLEVAGKLEITDNDAGEAAFVATTVYGSFGSMTIRSGGDWGYAADNSQPAIQNLSSSNTLTDTLSVSSMDGTTHTVTITIIGADEVDTLTDITLSWVAPSQREDDTSIALSEIAGYKIYYGTTQGEYTNSVDVIDSSAEGYTFKAFPPGTYFFVVTTLDTAGRESQYSAEVKKVN